MNQAAATAAAAAAQRAGWLKTLHQWHWISSAICLIGMLMFSFTGITLNHAADIESQPRTVQREAQLPPALLPLLQAPAGEEKKAALPPALRAWVAAELAHEPGGRQAEWSEDEIYLDLPRPGGDAWLRIERATGRVEFESSDRGWISYLNDLHKGRNTGMAWRWFIDVFAIACLVFCLSGLLILKFHALKRPSTWPLVGLGLVVPALLALLLMHG